jgi:Raf kinase inhibitor-like YbhB/YbcL family protein
MHTGNRPAEISQAVSYTQLKITSPAFDDGTLLPARYTCDGENVNPPLEIALIPPNTKCLAIIMTGSYNGKPEWAHWLAWNIPAVTRIGEKRCMEVEGLNYFGRKCYEGPCPAGGLHQYHIKVYALRDLLHLHSSATKEDVEKAISGLITGFGMLTCFYRRQIKNSSDT